MSAAVPDLSIANPRQQFSKRSIGVRNRLTAHVRPPLGARLCVDSVLTLPIRGDSMEPMLFSGDMVMIDTADTDVSQGGIFAVRDHLGGVVITEVEAIGPTRILCTPRNPRYQPFELAADGASIIGRAGARMTARL